MELELNEGTTLREVLNILHLPKDEVKQVFINGIRSDEDVIIKDGDRIAIFPPVAGG